ncbi:MAG: hypothetical protein Q4D30_07510 [Bacteroidales bacterium]|nr:hypothetical protein [Bacteroidales bacterium]
MKDLSSFAIKKEAMNELRGGDTQNCWCGGSSHVIPISCEEELTFDDLAQIMDNLCGSAGWGCTPA